MPKKNKEVVVDAPSYVRVRESHEVRATAEKLKFFSTCRKISKCVTLPTTVVNLLFLLFIGYRIIHQTQSSSQISILIIVTLFTGIINIFNGLLLLAKE